MTAGAEAAARDDFATTVAGPGRSGRADRSRPGAPGWATGLRPPAAGRDPGRDRAAGRRPQPGSRRATPSRPRTSGRSLGALAALTAVADRPGAARLDGRRALRVVRADGPHGPADRPGQRADVRPDPRARAGPRRPAGRRGLAGGLRRRRPDRHERGRRATLPATTSCGPSRPSWPSRSGSSTRSPGSVATSSCSWRRARPG